MKKFPCNTTRFFFEKVNGKQFHPKYSGCDDFTVRLQVRKHKSAKWDDIARTLDKMYWLPIFMQKGMCSTNDTQLVATFRNKKAGDHTNCIRSSPEFKKALRRADKLGLKECNYDWPLKCKLRGR